VVEAEGKEEEGERKAAHSLLDIVLCLCPTLTAANLGLVQQQQLQLLQQLHNETTSIRITVIATTP
jgi:hypothetical protein